MKKTLGKPENWQDFESLCKKLWGEIWECPEIKKNGRTGQKQQGVDIYGIPKGESDYFGIQCKGKDDYTKAVLTEKEINEEISKALLFKPKLKKFYFATTANKDSVIEEYIRNKDLESRKSGNFEIHLFSWEDIVDLIEENKKTFDWFVKNINHKSVFDVDLVFQDNSRRLHFSPKLYRNHIKYKLPDIEKYSGNPYTSNYSVVESREDIIEIATEPQPIRHYLGGITYNKSASVFSLRLINTGNTPIKNYKIYFEFIGKGITVDTVNKQRMFLDTYKHIYNTIIYEGSTEGVFEPSQNILVQKDFVRTDELCIRPTIETAQEIEIKWQLVSEDFDEKGSLYVDLEPEVIEKHSIEKSYHLLDDEIRLDNYLE